jgi:hypothetical protein
MITVVAMIGLLGSLLAVGFMSVRRATGSNIARSSLDGVAASQHARYASRSAFTADTDTLADMEPGWAYVDGVVASEDGSTVSVTLARLGGLPAAVLATAAEQDCVAAAVFDPDLRGNEYLRWPRSEAGCAAAEAVTRFEEVSW